MLSIDSLGGSGSELMQMLQRLTGQSDNTMGIAARSNGPPQGAPPDGPPSGAPPQLTDAVASYAEEAGLDEETIATLQDELNSEISAAFESAEDGADPREIIDAAIASKFEEYGLDGEAFISELKASMPEGGPPPQSSTEELTSDEIVSQLLSSLSSSADTSTTYSGLSLLNTIA